MKRIITIAGFLILGSLALAGAAQATPPSNLTSTTLGRISLGPFHESSHGFKISSRHPTDAVVLTTTINPGGSTGWHSHPCGVPEACPACELQRCACGVPEAGLWL